MKYSLLQVQNQSFDIATIIEPLNNICEAVTFKPNEYNGADSPNADNKVHFDMKSSLSSFSSAINSLKVPEVRKNTIYQCTNDLIDQFASFVGGLMTQDSGYTCSDALEMAKSYVCEYLNKSNTSYKRQIQVESCSTFVKPQEFAAGTHFEMKRSEGKNTSIPKLLQSKGHFISVAETIQTLFNNNKALRDLYFKYNEKERDHICEVGIYRSFCCGRVFRENELYKKYPESLQIRLFTDDFTVTNPLGPSASIHKLTAVYFCIENLPIELLSKTDNMYIAALIHSDDIKTKETDYNDIWRMVVRDIQQLEKFGFEVKDENSRILRGTISCICWDNLGANSSLALCESFSANHFCRVCKLTKAECQTRCEEVLSEYRTMEDYARQLSLIEDSTKVNFTESCGVKRYCSLNDLAYFKIFVNQSVDIMHDLNEGVIPFLLHNFFNLITSSKILTECALQKRFQFFDYGILSTKTVPAIIYVTKQNLNQTASKLMCLFRHLPFVLFDLRNHEKLKGAWSCVQCLLRIVQIAYSTELSEADIKELEHLVSVHLRKVQEVFKVKLIPKHHFLTHYGTLVRLMGPLTLMSTMRSESMHQELKRIIETCRNFINITKTITNRFQANLTFKGNTYLNQFKYGKKVSFEIFQSKIDNSERTLISSNFPCQNELYKLNWFSLNSYMYKKGLFVICDRKFLQIENLYLFNDEEYIACSQWDFVEFDEFLNSLQIVKSEPNTKKIIRFLDLKEKRLFECKSIDHKYFIIADTLIVKHLM